MRCRLTWLMVCMLVAFICGCVSKAQYETVSNDHQEAQADRDRCEAEKTKIEGQVRLRQDEIDGLSKRIDALNREIREKETIISLQSTFIRLFDDSKQTLQTSIDEQLAAQDIEMATQVPLTRLVLVDTLLFESGSIALSGDGKALLEKLTGLIAEAGDPFIRIQGHTDDRPMKPSAPYETNWELSVSRATAVARFLQEHVGVRPDRVSATGFGQYQPIASNDTEEGRRQNRRIEIFLETDDQ